MDITLCYEFYTHFKQISVSESWSSKTTIFLVFIVSLLEHLLSWLNYLLNVSSVLEKLVNRPLF